MVSEPDRVPLRRETIVAAARELISTDGVEALSLRRLASAFGVTAPALYAHVRSKGDLLRAVAEDVFASLVVEYEHHAGEDPLARMRAQARVYIDFARHQPELFRVLFLFPPVLGPADVPEDVELPAATAAFAFAAGAVDDAVAAGLLGTDDPLLATLTFWAGAHGVASVLQLGLGLPPELEDRMVEEMLDRLLAGYRSDTAA
ncbi:MAG: TetR/AcrR family transcriptional regulator [Acidimicrobiales bacterium]|nr:TetR/AcrR family transcriptional regulator [Acidimicrobiales bacterium]